MSPCPYCNYMFEGWFPLKEHLLTDVHCSVIERWEMPKIRQRKEYLATMAEAKAKTWVERPDDMVPGVQIDELLEVWFYFTTGGMNAGCMKVIQGLLPIRDFFYVKEIDASVAAKTINLRTRLVEHVAAHIYTNHRSVLDLSLENLLQYVNQKKIVLFDLPREILNRNPITPLMITVRDGEEATKSICKAVRDHGATATGLRLEDCPIKVEFEFRLSKEEQSDLLSKLPKPDSAVGTKRVLEIEDNDETEHLPLSDTIERAKRIKRQIKMNSERIAKLEREAGYESSVEE